MFFQNFECFDFILKMKNEFLIPSVKCFIKYAWAPFLNTSTDIFLKTFKSRLLLNIHDAFNLNWLFLFLELLFKIFYLNAASFSIWPDFLRSLLESQFDQKWKCSQKSKWVNNFYVPGRHLAKLSCKNYSNCKFSLNFHLRAQSVSQSNEPIWSVQRTTVYQLAAQSLYYQLIEHV